MKSPKETKSKKRIFWFEDDAPSLEDYCIKLCEEYDLTIGAHKDIIEQLRDKPFDLVLLDLMIHEFSLKPKSTKKVNNINFKGVHWTNIGVEFLKKLRDKEYEKYGFAQNIPVIVATANIEAKTKQAVESMNIESFLEKPITMDKLKIAIERVLIPSNAPEV